jgi:uroporphyrinogen III methyltransferase / synthase
MSGGDAGGMPRPATGPLSGKRIVVTRPRAQAGSFADRLKALGAEVLVIPMIRIEAPADRGPLLAAAAAAGEYDWIVFSSANAVTKFFDALREQGGDVERLRGPSICAVGPATADEITTLGLHVDVIPATFVGDAVAGEMVERGGVQGRRVLYPRAERARPVIPDTLRAAGAVVDEVIAYRTVVDDSVAAGLLERIEGGAIDVITFTSGSAVESFVDIVGADTRGALVASIGPITSAVARGLGVEVDLEAEVHTTEGLADALVRRFAAGGWMDG